MSKTNADLPDSRTQESRRATEPIDPSARGPKERHRHRRPRPRSQSAFGRMLSDLNALYRKHLSSRAIGGGKVGMKTCVERRLVLESALCDLHQQGFELRRLKNLRGQHVETILKCWRARNLQPSTTATYFSHLRTLCRWLEKPQLVDLIDAHVAADPALTRRRLVTNRDRSEEGAGVRFEEIFERALRIDRRFACQLALIAAFALRSQEAWLFRPNLAERNGELKVHWGTKGGRPRVLPLLISDEQRAVLEWAKTFVQKDPESMIPRGWTVQRWRWRYYWLCRRIGLTRRALAVTPHSLRHGALMHVYERLTGAPAPSRGGNLRRDDPAADRAAREVVAEYAGHSRPAVASIYLGGGNPWVPASQSEADSTGPLRQDTGAPDGGADTGGPSSESPGPEAALEAVCTIMRRRRFH